MDPVTSTQTPEHPVRQLHELIQASSDHITQVGCLRPGKRPVIPIAIRLDGGKSLEGTPKHRVEDVAAMRLVVTSEYRFKEGQVLEIELCVNNQIWEDRMRVLRVAPVAEGYRLDLESDTAAPRQTDEEAQPIIDPTHRLQSLVRERAWLGVAKEEIRTTTNAYLLARRSLGLLGTPLRARIARRIAAMPGSPAEAIEDERRRQVRRRTQADTYLVVYGEPEWGLLEARIVDVSATGLRMAVSARSMHAQGAGHPAAPELKCGTPVVVGLGAEEDALYVPAEVVRVEPVSGKDQYIGVQFVTPRSLEAFR